MKCDIIRDLLPSYIDGLTSETSNVAIEEHLEECEECRTYLEAMKKEMVSERYVAKTKEEIKEDIDPFIKIKRATARKIVGTVMICIFIFVTAITIYQGLYDNGMTTAKADDIEIAWKKDSNVVSLEFIPKKENYEVNVIGGWVAAEDLKTPKSEDTRTLEVTEKRVKPFSGEIIRNGLWEIVFLDEDTVVNRYGEVVDLTGEEVLEINFWGETKKVRIIDLYTEKGIQALK